MHSVIKRFLSFVLLILVVASIILEYRFMPQSVSVRPDTHIL